MSTTELLDLSECTEFRQRLESKTPPAATLVMAVLLLLVVACVVWAILAQASLVVIARGRVRPIETPNRIYSAVSPYLEGRVVEVFVEEGDRVAEGDLLVRFDTSLIDNEIAKRTYAIEAGKTELAKLHQLMDLLDQRTSVARARESAELNRLLAEHDRALKHRKSAIKRAEAALAKSRDHARRTRQLIEKGVVTEASWVEAQTQLRQDELSLEQARLPIDSGAIAVRRQALELVDRDHHLKHAELSVRIASQEGEVKAEEKELDTRQYERRQAELRAPIDGVIVTGSAKGGDVVTPRQLVMEIAEENSLRFEAQVSTEDVGDLREGMTARLKLDAFDFQKFGTVSGTVSYISPDSEISRPTTDGDAFYEVKIDLDDNQLRSGDLVGNVKLGMAGVAEIVTERENLLTIFARQMRKTIRIE